MLSRQGEEAPVIKLVNVVLMSASRRGKRYHTSRTRRIPRRYRVDGILYNISAALKMRDAITSASRSWRTDIAEKRMPQDGRIKIRFRTPARQGIDFRVSCLPTLFGEKIVMRLLDKGKLMRTDQVGFEQESLPSSKRRLRSPGAVPRDRSDRQRQDNNLYRDLQAQLGETNIMTAEDPVESTCWRNRCRFANRSDELRAALRSFLRPGSQHHPGRRNRDFETAESRSRHRSPATW